MDKEDLVHKFSGILAIKKNDIMPFAAIWMDLEIVTLSEISHTEKDKFILRPLYVKSKRKLYQ